MIALCLLIFFVAGPSFVLADTGADDTLEAYLDQLYKTGDFVEEDFEDFEDFENLMYLAQPKFQITGDDTRTEDNSTSDNSTSDNSSSESSSDSSSSDSSSSTTEGKPEIICSLHRGIDSGEKSQLVLFAATMMLLLLIRRRFAQ